MVAIRENRAKVSVKDFEKAMQIIKPSMNEESIKYYNAIGDLISKNIETSKKEELQYFR
jgi:SpoVK/Ycf46/Vps4 family AAA+-type ATPase